MNLSDLIAMAPRDESLKALAALFDSLEAVLSYAKDGRDTFMDNREKQDAIMYRILCAGEACKRFCDAYEGQQRPDAVSRINHANTDITKVNLTPDQWTGLMGMRDVLGHRIDEQNLEIVWRTVELEIPVMVQPVWDALRWATIKWFRGDHSPGRRAAKQKANEEMKETLESLHASLAGMARVRVDYYKGELSGVAQQLISSALSRLRDFQLPPNTSPAEIALNDVVREIDLHGKLTAISEYIEDHADDLGLENEAFDRGPRPSIEEVLTEDLQFDESTGEWHASAVGTITYHDDEGGDVGSDVFFGTLCGTVDDALTLEVVNVHWEKQAAAEPDSFDDDDDLPPLPDLRL